MQETTSTPTLPPESVARRRAAARRWAWLIGGAVLLIYVLGFWVKRG